MGDQYNDQYWMNQNSQPQEAYDGFTDKSQILDFQTFDQNNSFYSSNMYPASQYPDPGQGAPFGAMQQQSSFHQGPSIFTPTMMSTHYGESMHGADGVPNSGMDVDPTEFDEPPLLEELEIDPKRIMEKSLAVLNPFKASAALVDVTETDLAGPITFCLTLAACLSVSGSRAQFGYIYGLSLISVMVMFCLISLMCNVADSKVTVSAVASVLGYSMLPIVGLSIVGVFVTLNNAYGMAIAGAAIFLATMSSSKMFCLMTGDPHQRYLIAYPSALLYAIFSLLVLF
ncbi:protein YIPF5 homolog [Anopheles ziemanni]|nr:protein YIPF5 homolog [Anopheles coustani]XP_058117474.1 protein YIPF5 homolog [Anopheles coustani]XP_058172337.1 protein YIPF5 homolog [Anopheles ziemanni]